MLRDTDKKGNGKRAATVQASPAMGFILPQTYNLSLVLSQPQVIFFTSNASPSGFFFFFQGIPHSSLIPPFSFENTFRTGIKVRVYFTAKLQDKLMKSCSL
jgi:hypothetical protein